MNVTTLYLWLAGCDPAWLNETKLEALLLEAVRVGGFELLYSHCSTNDGRIVALAVVGESHLVLHGDVGAGTLCAEVLSCTTREAAERAVAVVRERVPHETANHQRIDYELEQGFEVDDSIDLG